MTHSIQPVILCGGSGTRLWPLSRAGFPKQFLSLLGNESLFQQAATRLNTLGGNAPLVIGNEEHRFLMLEQLREVGIAPKAVLLEPMGRNTAPALTLAALAAEGDPVLVVTPADQTVQDSAAFTAALRDAVAQAQDGAIVILGVVPDRAETGYGYIRSTDGTVEQFVEKPDARTAAKYVADGNYFWNGGMFVLKASVWLKALGQFRPDILEATQAAWNTRSGDAPFVRPDKDLFSAVPSESVDYAVIEKCPGHIPLRMVKLGAGWSDLGSWDAVWQSAEKDAQGNAHVGDAMITEGQNVFVHASNRLVSVVGLKNVVVIETADAVLVADRSRSQEVKQVVAELGKRARCEHTEHRKVHRPWGWYDSIDEGAGFKVKRILVNPGASLSLQKHSKRAEHWVVVSGVAEVTCGEKKFQLTANQSTYIPLGETHRLANPGTQPLEIIEVQSGSYLGEDDIVRIEDHYGRHQ